jgi:E3 ubiquitin-protein ligase DOA10
VSSNSGVPNPMNQSGMISNSIGTQNITGKKRKSLVQKSSQGGKYDINQILETNPAPYWLEASHSSVANTFDEIMERAKIEDLAKLEGNELYSVTQSQDNNF